MLKAAGSFEGDLTSSSHAQLTRALGDQVTVVSGVLGERAELLGALALVLHATDGVMGAGPPAEVAA